MASEESCVSQTGGQTVGPRDMGREGQFETLWRLRPFGWQQSGVMDEHIDGFSRQHRNRSVYIVQIGQIYLMEVYTPVAGGFSNRIDRGLPPFE